MSFIHNLIEQKTAGDASTDHYLEDENDTADMAEMPPPSYGDEVGKDSPDVDAAKMDALFEAATVETTNSDFPGKPEPVRHEPTPDVFELRNPIIEPSKPVIEPAKAVEVPSVRDEVQRAPIFETKPATDATRHEQAPKLSDTQPKAPEKTLSTPFPSAANAGPRRVGRVKTRLLGFDRAGQSSADVSDPEAATESAPQTRYPVGWIAIVDGPGRGEFFTLQSGMSQIGRGEDQAIKLDFGDASISRNNHAAIVYDVENHTFLLGHGGKANLVRLNDKPLLKTEQLGNADKIKIGETTLQLVALCNEQFNWEEDSTKGAEDVAIA